MVTFIFSGLHQRELLQKRCLLLDEESQMSYGSTPRILWNSHCWRNWWAGKIWARKLACASYISFLCEFLYRHPHPKTMIACRGVGYTVFTLSVYPYVHLTILYGSLGVSYKCCSLAISCLHWCLTVTLFIIAMTPTYLFPGIIIVTDKALCFFFISAPKYILWSFIGVAASLGGSVGSGLGKTEFLSVPDQNSEIGTNWKQPKAQNNRSHTGPILRKFSPILSYI